MLLSRGKLLMLALSVVAVTSQFSEVKSAESIDESASDVLVEDADLDMLSEIEKELLTIYLEDEDDVKNALRCILRRKNCKFYSDYVDNMLKGKNT